MPIEIKRLNSQSADFWQTLKELQTRESESDEAVLQSVNEIIKAVRTRGDAALIELTARFDGWQAGSMSQLEIPLDRLERAYQGMPEPERTALDQAAERIRSYAQHQKLDSWEYTEADGTLLEIGRASCRERV